MEMWFDSLKKYAYAEVYQAVRDYISTKTYAPVPAEIIRLIPRGKGGAYKPMYRDGKMLIQCRRCRDTGLVTYLDAEGRTVGFPCDCPAGHDKYAWGWLAEEEQDEFCRKNGRHGEIVGENWDGTNRKYEGIAG